MCGFLLDANVPHRPQMGMEVPDLTNRSVGVLCVYMSGPSPLLTHFPKARGSAELSLCSCPCVVGFPVISDELSSLAVQEKGECNLSLNWGFKYHILLVSSLPQCRGCFSWAKVLPVLPLGWPGGSVSMNTPHKPNSGSLAGKLLF